MDGETHTYRSSLTWQGSTGLGYERYDRTHRIEVPPAPELLSLSSDPAFLGDAQLPNPEQLLLAAASSCQMLAFLALAARSRIDVIGYQDHAEAIMPETSAPMRITRITLRPRIAVARGGSSDRVRRLVDRAHEGCFVANSLTTEIIIEPTVELVAPTSGA